MPIVEGQGSIFDSGAQWLVNPVNTVGVMGAGLALEFKKRFPDVFLAYQSACRRGEVRIGEMFLSRPVVHFPTKEHWKAPSRLEYVERGLVPLAALVKAQGVQTIAIPALGCGLGGLAWSDVKVRIEAAFQNVDAQVYLFGPR